MSKIIKNKNNIFQDYKKIDCNESPEKYIFEIINKCNYKIVAISGASGGGKTILSEKLCSYFNNKVTVLNIDDYFKYNLTDRMNKKISGYDWNSRIRQLFLSHLILLKNGKKIKKPVFSYSTQDFKKEKELVNPKKVILIEGTLDFSDIADFTIFTWSPDDILIDRVVSRGGYKTVFKTKNALKRHLEEVSMINYHNKLLPYFKKANIIFDTNNLVVYKRI
jgi:uridine kinase